MPSYLHCGYATNHPWKRLFFAWFRNPTLWITSFFLSSFLEMIYSVFKIHNWNPMVTSYFKSDFEKSESWKHGKAVKGNIRCKFNWKWDVGCLETRCIVFFRFARTLHFPVVSSWNDNHLWRMTLDSADEKPEKEASQTSDCWNWLLMMEVQCVWKLMFF